MAVLPVYNVLAAPGSDIPISKDEYQRAVGRVPVVGEKVTMIFLKEKEMRLRLSEDSFFSNRTERGDHRDRRAGAPDCTDRGTAYAM